MGTHPSGAAKLASTGQTLLEYLQQHPEVRAGRYSYREAVLGRDI